LKNINPTVAVIDDDCDDRVFIIAAFQRINPNLNFIEAEDGRDFVEKIPAAGNIDMILCDLSMPRMNGMELLNYLRSASILTSTPVIMFSTSSLDVDRKEALARGAVTFITKPSLIHEYDKLAKRILSVFETA
jgi:CheY-like chemotaxis protein